MSTNLKALFQGPFNMPINNHYLSFEEDVYEEARERSLSENGTDSNALEELIDETYDVAYGSVVHQNNPGMPPIVSMLKSDAILNLSSVEIPFELWSAPTANSDILKFCAENGVGMSEVFELLNDLNWTHMQPSLTYFEAPLAKGTEDEYPILLDAIHGDGIVWRCDGMLSVQDYEAMADRLGAFERFIETLAPTAAEMHIPAFSVPFYDNAPTLFVLTLKLHDSFTFRTDPGMLGMQLKVIHLYVKLLPPTNNT